MAKVICYEAGSEGDPWSCPFAASVEDRRALQMMDSRQILVFEECDDRVRIRGRDKVGLLLLPSGMRLHIQSKIPDLVLLEWLAFLGTLPPLDRWLPDTGVVTGHSLHECIARLFAHELMRITRQHLRKDYTLVLASDSMIRGRILVDRLSRSMQRLPKMPQACRDRTLNTKYNMVLAVALDKAQLLLMDSSSDDRQHVGALKDSWACINRGLTDLGSALNEVQWATPPGYRAGLQLARFVLRGAAVDPTVGVGGRAFVLSLAHLWEESLARLLDELSTSTGWEVAPRNESSRKWHDSVGSADSSRWMTTDVLLKRQGHRWVVDAKYKRSFGNESRNDRFQMAAYVIGFDAIRATLAFPTASQDAVQSRVLLDTVFGSKTVRIDSFELPMASGPGACRHALLALLNEELG